MRTTNQTVQANNNQTEEGEMMGFALQPIHDTELRHVADRIVFFQQPTSEEEVKQFAQSLAITLYQLSECGRIGHREIFINVPSGAIEHLELAPLPSGRAIISLANDVEFDASTVALIKGVRAKGYGIEAPGSALINVDLDVIKLVAIARIGNPHALPKTEGEDARWSHLRLLGDKIKNSKTLGAYRACGCHYFDALNLADILEETDLARHDDSREVHLRLIRELCNDNIQLAHLHDIILQMPQTHLAILKMANSVRYQRQAAVRYDLKGAIQVLGFTALRRLIMMITLADDTPVSRLKLRMALFRAFMCREVAKMYRKTDSEKAFNVGLFSMLGSLLNARQDVLVNELPISDDLRLALTERSGHLGLVLSLVEGYSQRLDDASAQSQSSGLHKCYLTAIRETEELLGLL